MKRWIVNISFGSFRCNPIWFQRGRSHKFEGRSIHLNLITESPGLWMILIQQVTQIEQNLHNAQMWVTFPEIWLRWTSIIFNKNWKKKVQSNLFQSLNEVEGNQFRRAIQNIQNSTRNKNCWFGIHGSSANWSFANYVIYFWNRERAQRTKWNGSQSITSNSN